jgi:hypothetical protein
MGAEEEAQPSITVMIHGRMIATIAPGSMNTTTTIDLDLNDRYTNRTDPVDRQYSRCQSRDPAHNQDDGRKDLQQGIAHHDRNGYSFRLESGPKP